MGWRRDRNRAELLYRQQQLLKLQLETMADLDRLHERLRAWQRELEERQRRLDRQQAALDQQHTLATFSQPDNNTESDTATGTGTGTGTGREPST